MLNLTTQAIDKWYEDNDKQTSYNIRASDLGDDCSRRIWYKLNGAPLEKFNGRMLRLFDRGHKEEDRFIEALKGIGISIWGEQKALMAFGREFGHIDGLGSGFPEAPKTVHLLEFKTYNDKQFKKLKKDGMPPHKHLVQMQVYMGLLKDVKRAMYLAINKNDDEIWQARIEFDPEFFKAQMQKAERITNLKEPPQRLDDRPEFWKCKMCYLRDYCHGKT